MSKWTTGSVYIGNTIYYLTNLPNPFAKGLGVNLEGRSILSELILLMHIDILGSVNHLYLCLFSCFTTYQGSWLVLQPSMWKLGTMQYL